MGTVGVAGNVAFGASLSIFATQRQHVAAVATPVGAEIRNGFETMGYTMVNFFSVVVLKP